ncbi:MAG TPA: hypothetical protein VFV81_05210, partial [Verrucomicrobiae bacterium]|nr:hypothetical protein [Verrucomicrobiae bacterium]
MKSLFPISCAFLLFAVARVSAAMETPTPVHLRCEYRVNPDGIGETTPRLAWQLQADPVARGVRQTAYQILVASSPEQLQTGRGDLWDTGKIPSDAMQQIDYGGKPPASREQCWWRVRVWDEHGQPSAWSEPAHWSMGLLHSNDWQAQWIGFDTAPPTDGSELDNAARTRLQRQRWAYAPMEPSRTSPLTAYVRGEIILPSNEKLLRAALALSPDQTCAITANGKAIGTVTRWEQMRPVDLTAALAPGTNVIGLAITQRDGYRPAALGEVELQFADGNRSVVPIDA